MEEKGGNERRRKGGGKQGMKEEERGERGREIDVSREGKSKKMG